MQLCNLSAHNKLPLVNMWNLYSYHLEEEDGEMCVGEGGREELSEEAIHDMRLL